MSEKNAKPAVTAANGGATKPPPPFPVTKSQLYNPTRHPYRPQPNNYRHRHRRRVSCSRCLCLTCCWSIILLLALLLLAAIAGAAVYVLYRPHRPTFTVSALRIANFNLSTTADDITHLTSRLNLTLSTKNPNKKIQFRYDSLTITAISDQISIGNGSFQSFTSDPNNITFIRSTLSSAYQVLDPGSVKALRSDLKKKNNGLSLKIVMDTMVVVKMEGVQSKKVGIRVTCDGIHGHPPKGKSPAVASTANAKCKVDLRIKIWKWSF